MVYVDFLLNQGFRFFGTRIQSCHMFADTLEELHEMADRIGLKRSHFQDNSSLKHYDLVSSKRALGRS